MKGSIGVLVTRIAVALYLLADGCLGLTKQSWFKTRSDIETVLRELLGKGDFTSALVIIFSVLAIIAAVFLILELFEIRVPFVDIIILVFMIVWVVFIVLFDIARPISHPKNWEFIPWAKYIGAHLMVLGSLMSASHKFGD